MLALLLQLAAIQQPAHIGKKEQQVCQYVLFRLHQLATRNLVESAIIEHQPKTSQTLEYHRHFMFKSAPHAEPQKHPLNNKD